MRLVRKGSKGSKGEYVFDVNASDLPDPSYHANFATDAFYSRISAKGLFFVNAQFPFATVYQGNVVPEVERLSGQRIERINGDTDANFDDVDDALGGAVEIDYEKKLVRLDNQVILDKLSELYLNIREHYIQQKPTTGNS